MTRYELLERIGAGGMAEIFRGKAVAAGGFEKPVAIKRILPHLSQDKRFVEMLIAEANILSQLRHRNIVQIFDVGVGEDGQYFLVMEYVHGLDLGAVQRRLEKRRKRLPIELCLHIGAEVCEALEHAHRARGADGKALRLVHRDVSPSNVLLSQSGEVKLTDFGIAKRPEENTGHGGVRGKFAYISPEQASNLHVDARSDVYSLGIVLYEIMLGHRLFSNLPDFDALRAVREGHIQRPREIDPELDPTLEAILLKCLNKDPELRFDSAGEVGEQLRGFRYSLPETAGDPASEIAQIVKRVAAPQPRGKSQETHDHEPTIVRIETAAGFTLSGLETPSSTERAVDEFDNEETRAMAWAPNRMPRKADTNLEEMLGVQPVSAQKLGSAGERAPMPLAAPRAESGPSGATPVTTVIPDSPERAATPTIRELFYKGGLLDKETPVGTAQTAKEVREQEDLLLREQASRRRAILLLAVAAVAVAVVSFVIAGSLMTTGSEEDDVVDAAPPPPDAMADAGPLDAMEMQPEIVKPKKKATKPRRAPKKKAAKKTKKAKKTK